MTYLLDTNVISELTKTKPHAKLLRWFEEIPDQALHVSVLTLGEIRKGIESISDHKRQARLRVWLDIDLPAWFAERVLTVDQNVADRWGGLQHQMGRSVAAIDSLLAATALFHDLRLVTRNVKDFQFPLLQVINPWD